MPNFIVRLFAESLVRLNEKPYLRDDNTKSVSINLPDMTIAVFDNLTPLKEFMVPRGLIIQIELDANNIDESVRHAEDAATSILSMLSCMTIASISQPRPVWVYDSTPRVEERAYRIFAYDTFTAPITKPLDQAALAELLEEKFEKFLAEPNIKADFKERLQRTVSSFRRGLADNDDPLSEFMVYWSSMEGLDCVYRTVFPTAQSKFMDGVRDVLSRQGQPAAFDALKDLRDDVAHGKVSFATAIATANTNMELVRKALLLMVMRILKLDRAIIDKVLANVGYKGKFKPLVRFVGTIGFDPGDVKRLDTHPVIDVTCVDVLAVENGDKLNQKPDWRLTPRNCKGAKFSGLELWGDSGATVKVSDAQATVIKASVTPPIGTSI